MFVRVLFGVCCVLCCLLSVVDVLCVHVLLLLFDMCVFDMCCVLLMCFVFDHLGVKVSVCDCYCYYDVVL